MGARHFTSKICNNKKAVNNPIKEEKVPGITGCCRHMEQLVSRVPI